MIDRYLSYGWALVPCRQRGKIPIVKGWESGTIRDASWWRMSPLDNVGIVTGRPSGFFVLDEDPDNGGDVSLAELVRTHGDLPRTRTHRTGSGGRHFLFAMPADFEPTNRRGELPSGLDIRGTGGQIVAPPSVTDKGAYVVLDDAPIAGAPGWLLDLIRPKVLERQPYAGPAPTAPTGRLTAWAGARLAGRCGDLAAAANGTRNDLAMQVARDLVKLSNAPWAGVSFEQVMAEYHRAADACGLDDGEAMAVWRKAVNKIGHEQEMPPADRPLDRVPAGGPEYLRMDAATGALVPLDGATVIAASEDITAAPLTLPGAFWAAHPTLGHIRAAAHARKRSADVALYSTLARLSAMWPHQLRVDTGVGRPASLNLFVAVVGPSGVGKSTGLGVARDLLPVAPWLDEFSFRDRVPLGSGEGLAETFMGMKEIVKAKVDPSTGAEETDTETGKPAVSKPVKVRAQVRHNALFWLDEGEILTNMKDRAGQTIGATIRSAATGDTIGSANADTQTRREVREGEYSTALVAGFQPAKMGPLFDDAGGGTPQRFLYVWAQDATVPRTRSEAPAAPGPLEGVWTVGTGVTMTPDGLPRFSVVEPGEVAPDLTPFTVAETIKDRLWDEDGMERAELDSHAPGTRVKLAALLAALLGGREITEWHWALAEQLWSTSCAVRDHALTLSRAKALDEQRAKTVAHVERERLTKATLAEDDERRADAAVMRLAADLARRVHAQGPTARAALVRSLKSTRRANADAALSLAVESGWLHAEVSANGQGSAYAPGTSQPAEKS